MGVGERASVIGDMRKLLQDFLAPELGELKVRLDSLADGQKALADGQRAIVQEMHEGFKAQTESRQEMEARLLREIKNSEEKLLMRIQLAEANMKIEQAQQTAATALRENEQLKREKTQ